MRFTEKVLYDSLDTYLSYQDYCKAWRLATAREREELAQRWAGYEGRRRREVQEPGGLRLMEKRYE